MPLNREITLPDMGLQDPQTLSWKNNLRSPRQPSPSRSRSPSYLRSGTLRDRSPSPLRSTTSPVMRRSRSRTRSGTRRSTSTSRSLNDLEGIESDYIKNLQQQIYFLEIEANYLREQARKATDMHPKMTAEAERMLNKLRQMQGTIDSLNLELRRKESSIDILHTEKERVFVKLEDEESTRIREKQLLMEEIMDIKKQKDLLALENAKKQSTLESTRDDRDRLSLSLRSAEEKLDLSRGQLDQRLEQHKLTQLALDEKRAELITTERALKDAEDRYYNSTILLKDRTVNDLRTEVRVLRQKLNDAEMKAGDERVMRGKVEDDSVHLFTDNSLLNQRISELENQLSRERSLRESADLRRSSDLAELSTLSEREKLIEYDLRQTREQLLVEKERSQRYLEELARGEQVKSSLELNTSSARTRQTEAESKVLVLIGERDSLKKDKSLLVDHISELQQQLSRKEDEVLRLTSRMRSMGVQLTAVEREKEMEETIQSQKWHDFESLADSMKHLSHNMARASSPARSPRSRSPHSTRSPRSGRLLDM